MQKLLLKELFKNTAEAADLIGNKRADKITSQGKTNSKEKENGR